VKTYNRIALIALVVFSLSLVVLLAAAGTHDLTTLGEVVLRYSAVMTVLSLAALVISTLVMAIKDMDR
jgi:hypothetical protein